MLCERCQQREATVHIKKDSRRKKTKTTKTKTMKIQIDLKSAVCGLAVGIAIMLVVGADSYSKETGRYQISHAGDGGNSFITVIDTKTGEVWSHGTGTDGMGNTKLQNFWNPK